MAETTSVRFLKAHDDYTKGQTADLPSADADQLIADGVAVATDTPASGGAARDRGTEPAQGLTDAKGQPLQPGFSNSPPAAEQDGIAGQRARDAGPAPGVVKRPR